MGLADIHDWLLRPTPWRQIGWLALGTLACVGAFALRGAVLEMGASAEPGRTPDGRWWYTPGEARTYLDALGPRGRALYAATQLSLDVVFPLLYGGLFAALLVRLLPDGFARWLVWAPVLMVAADLGENVLLASVASGRLAASPLPVQTAACLTLLKWSLFYVLAVVLALGSVAAVTGLRTQGAAPAEAAVHRAVPGGSAAGDLP